MLTRSDVAQEIERGIERALREEAKRRGEESFLRAVYDGDTQRVRDMLEGCSEFGKADPRLRNAEGISALEIARRKGHKGVAVDLLKAGARPTIAEEPSEKESEFWRKTAASLAEKGDWESVELVLRSAPAGKTQIDLSDRKSFWLEPQDVLDAMAMTLLSGERDEEALSLLRINRSFLRMNLDGDARIALERRISDLKGMGLIGKAGEFEGFRRLADPASEPESGDFEGRLTGRRLKAGESAEDLREGKLKGGREADRKGGGVPGRKRL